MMNHMNPMGGNGMNPIKLIQTLQQAKGNPMVVMEGDSYEPVSE